MDCGVAGVPKNRFIMRHSNDCQSKTLTYNQAVDPLCGSVDDALRG